METVELTTADGVTIEGDLAGSGTLGIVLAHGLKYIDGKDSFRDQLECLGELGFTALSISFRGYPAREIPPTVGGRDLDLLAAVAYLAERGCSKVFVLGSSMGGWVALAAVDRLVQMPAFGGLILLSAGDPGAADAIEHPKLFLVAEDDPRILERVRTMHDTAAKPKELKVFPSGGHGQALFETRGDEVLAAIESFVTTWR